jgi:hypothetical protein
MVAAKKHVPIVKKRTLTIPSLELEFDDSD